MKVRIVQQMSGLRPDGTRWPGVGQELDVSDEEGMSLCIAHNGTPIAVPVPEPDAKVEMRSPESGKDTESDQGKTEDKGQEKAAEQAPKRQSTRSSQRSS